MKSAFQAIFVIVVIGLLTFAASRLWYRVQEQDKKMETLIHNVETLRILTEKPAPAPVPEVVPPPPVFPFFQAIDQKPTIDEATSPDGEWIADVRALGRTPFSRGTSFWLELMNQTGKPNRMIYLDWFERPRDARIQPYPVGWSADGRSIYLSYGNLPGANIHEPGGYAFMNAGEVFRVSLDDTTGDANNRVNPYGGDYPKDSIGRLLDILPRQDAGLWLEETRENVDGKGKATPPSRIETRLVMFPLETNTPPRILLTLPTDKNMRVSSAIMSNDTKDVFYVIHQDKKNDELFYLDTSSSSVRIPIRIDLVRFHGQLRRQGLTTPYTLELEKTALTTKNDLFLIVTGANGKRVTNRWMNLNEKPSLSRD